MSDTSHLPSWIDRFKWNEHLFPGGVLYEFGYANWRLQLWDINPGGKSGFNPSTIKFHYHGGGWMYGTPGSTLRAVPNRHPTLQWAFDLSAPGIDTFLEKAFDDILHNRFPFKTVSDDHWGGHSLPTLPNIGKDENGGMDDVGESGGGSGSSTPSSTPKPKQPAKPPEPKQPAGNSLYIEFEMDEETGEMVPAGPYRNMPWVMWLTSPSGGEYRTATTEEAQSYVETGEPAFER